MDADTFARIYVQYLAVCERTGMTPRTPDDTRALLAEQGLLAPIDVPVTRAPSEGTRQ